MDYEVLNFLSTSESSAAVGLVRKPDYSDIWQ